MNFINDIVKKFFHLNVIKIYYFGTKKMNKAYLIIKWIFIYLSNTFDTVVPPKKQYEKVSTYNMF